MNRNSLLLCVNAGSSSIKLAAFAAEASERELADVEIKNVTEYEAGLAEALDQLRAQLPEFTDESVAAVGYRIVHGGDQAASARLVDDELLVEIQRYAAFDPEHTPASLEIMALLRHQLGDARHIACFDTAFFHELPRLAQIIPLPRRFEQLGLKRYGFHGLSYEYLLGQLVAQYPQAASEKVVFAHLGSGASLAAVQAGRPVDTTMGFTPASGIVMSSRSGSLDPSIYGFLQRQTGMTLDEWTHVINQESGLLGVSDESADMYTLIQHEAQHLQAAEAIALFVYRVRMAIGEMTAAMGGIDRLVFSGGIGERSAVLRERIVDGLDYIGFTLDLGANQAAGSDDATIAAAGAKPIHVMHTNENRIIAEHIRTLL